MELCRQDGDLETPGVREDRKSRLPIIKKAQKSRGDTKSSDDPLLIAKMDKNNGVQIVSNGSTKSGSKPTSNNNHHRRSVFAQVLLARIYNKLFFNSFFFL